LYLHTVTNTYSLHSVAVIIGGFTTVLSLISSNVAGSTKKSTVTALFMISYAVGKYRGYSISFHLDADLCYPTGNVIGAFRRFGGSARANRLLLTAAPPQDLKLSSTKMLLATTPL